jgi:hypothetical protein
MPIETRLQLKTYFETGDIPTEDQFIGFLDSYWHLTDPNSGSVQLTGSLDVSGSINATGTASFGFISSSLPSGSDDTVVILDDGEILRQREIDSRVWGTSLVDGNDNLTTYNIPQANSTNQIRDSYIWASVDQNSVGIGPAIRGNSNYPATLTVSGSISSSGFVHFLGDVTASGAIGSKYVFTYLAEDLVHVEANGQVTTGTPALDAAASVTAGI